MDEIRQWRERHGMTEGQLAKKAGLLAHDVRAVEIGAYGRVSSKALVSILRVLFAADAAKDQQTLDDLRGLAEHDG